MPPKGKNKQNQVLAPMTRNQKRKNNDNLIPETPAKKTKAPTKRGQKKKEPILNNDGDVDNETQEPVKAPTKRDRKKKPILNNVDDIDNETQEPVKAPTKRGQKKKEPV